MAVYPLKIYTLGFMLALSGTAETQKTIIISDSLSANADKLDVHMGSFAMGKIRKFGFGDYTIISSKGMGVTTENSETKLFKTQSDSKSRNFSFVMSNKATDSANVNAGAQTIIVQSLRKFSVGNDWYLGSDEQVESTNFAGLIIINRDTSETWAWFMGGTSRNETGNYQAYLTNGKRKILLAPVSSNKKIQYANPLNAAGYEFIEDGQSLCAVQYYGTGKHANIVWMHKSPDPKMKLILASVMAAILLVNSPASPIN